MKALLPQMQEVALTHRHRATANFIKTSKVGAERFAYNSAADWQGPGKLMPHAIMQHSSLQTLRDPAPEPTIIRQPVKKVTVQS